MDVLSIDYNSPEAKYLFSKSLKTTGFAVFNHHPISNILIDELYEEWMGFFNHSTKHQYLYHKDTQDGYFPITTSETAKGATLKDLKEFFQFYPWGLFPSWMSSKTASLYEQLNDMACKLLCWLEAELPQEIQTILSMPLSSMIENSLQTMLRIIHYPPLHGNEPQGAVRAAAHEDINLLTLLVGATSAGLQVQDNHGKWYDVPASKESIVVNVGDMLALATKHFYRSTTHRVINPKARHIARLSMPLFLHPRPEVLLSPSKTAGQYLHERLLELGVIS